MAKRTKKVFHPTSVRLPADLDKDLRKAADKQGISLTTLLISVLRMWQDFQRRKRLTTQD